jgi:tetratricopeptide (TPR) repeat protein
MFGGTSSGSPGIVLTCFSTGSTDTDVTSELPIIEQHVLMLNPASIRGCLSSIRQAEQWKSDDRKSRIWKTGRSLVFQFVSDNPPSPERKIRFEEDDAEIVIKWMSHNSHTGRNMHCPCNSGKKFKRCCALEEAGRGTTVDLPEELDWLGEMELDDPDHHDTELYAYANQARLGPAGSTENSSFWANLGMWAVSKGEPDHALECLERALSLSPNDHGYKLTTVSLLSSMGRTSDASSLLDEVPVGTPGRSFEHAGLLRLQGDEREAIAQLELAIFEDPEFIPAYEKLLEILEKYPENPMFEYWIDQSVMLIPKSPLVAYSYAENRWVDGKYEELAEADWFDDLDLTPNNFYISSADSINNHPIYFAKRAKLFRDLAQCRLDNDPELLKNIVNGIDEYEQFANLINLQRHLCEEGKIISALAANSGLSNLIPKAHGLVCDDCTRNKNGIPKYTDTLLAAAAAQNGDLSLSVAHCDAVLKEDPKEDEVLTIYGSALFDLAKKNSDLIPKAISALESHLDLEPVESNSVIRRLELSNVLSSLASLNQQYGRPGTAHHYYEKLSEVDPLSSAYEGQAFLYLIEGKFELAQDHLNMSFEILKDLTEDPEVLEKFNWNQETVIDELTAQNVSSQTTPTVVAEALVYETRERFNIWVDGRTLSDLSKTQRTEFAQMFYSKLLGYKQYVFDELVAFSLANKGSMTNANDLIEKNKEFGSGKLMSIDEIRPERISIQNLFPGDSHGNDGLSRQTQFLMTLEQNSDFSMIHQSLNDELPVLDDLPLIARSSLYEAERRFLSDTPMSDYSPVVLSYAKSLEVTLKQIVFEQFRIAGKFQLGKSNRSHGRSKAIALLHYLEKGQHLELGTMALILRLCNGRTAENEPIVGVLRDFILDDLNGAALLEQVNIELIERISKDFRNPSAHSELSSRSQVLICRELCFTTLNSFEKAVLKIYS